MKTDQKIPWDVAFVTTITCQSHLCNILRIGWCSCLKMQSMDVSAGHEQWGCRSDTQWVCWTGSESVALFVLYTTERAEERAGVEAHFPTQNDYIKARCYFAVMSCHGRVWAACVKCKGVFLKAMCSNLQLNHLLINDFPCQYSLYTIYCMALMHTVRKHFIIPLHLVLMNVIHFFHFHDNITNGKLLNDHDVCWHFSTFCTVRVTATGTSSRLFVSLLQTVHFHYFWRHQRIYWGTREASRLDQRHDLSYITWTQSADEAQRQGKLHFTSSQREKCRAYLIFNHFHNLALNVLMVIVKQGNLLSLMKLYFPLEIEEFIYIYIDVYDFFFWIKYCT